MLCTNRMGRLLERPQDSELQMGKADRKKQREMSRKFRFEVTILQCQVSEGLVDSEKVLGRTQAHTMVHLEELVNISGQRCSTAEMSHNRSHNDHVVVFEDH